jgi:hypothetical protein
MKTKIAPEYDPKFLETERPQPLVDNQIELLIQEVMSGKLAKDISDQVYTNFKKEMAAWLLQSKLNTITGLDNFNRVDVINGCTQFIDTTYMNGPVQVLAGDYRYHTRLGNWYTHPGFLSEEKQLVVAWPFPSTGDTHPQMKEVLDEARDKGISVHVDGAWFTCCRGIHFDVSHPSIRSVGISLSKGLGLGWNRVGLRWTRETTPDAITIMNDYHMNNRALVKIGLHFLRNTPTDYLWSKYGDVYYKVCADFGLTPTNSIHLALQNNNPVGVSPLIRYLENASA